MLITLDLIGIDRSTSDRIASRILSQTGIKREAVRIVCSHTHSGPVVGNNLLAMFDLPQDQVEKVGRYTSWLVEQIVRCSVSAVNSLRPASLGTGQSTCTLAVNRRNNPEARVPELRRNGQLRGPIDHSVPVVKVRTLDDDKKQAVVFGYACHNTVLAGYEWCGDYAGFAQSEIEATLPGTQAMFVSGCGGDQNPLPRRTVELAREYGKSLARAVQAGLQGGLAGLQPVLETRLKEVPLAYYRVPTRAELEDTLENGSIYPKRWAKHLLTGWELYEPRHRRYPYPVQFWKLGSLGWVALGGEVTVDYALRIKQELGDQTWVSAYANDVMAYIPSRRVWDEGGYEGGDSMTYYGLPSRWSGDVEERILQGVHHVVRGR